MKIFGPPLLVTVAGFVIAYQYVDPAPPDRIAIATGGKEGAYYAFAQRYREILARHGITLEVHATAGSMDNIKLLQDRASEIDIAFVQGGLQPPTEPEGLAALGSVYFEPLWLFYRSDLTPDTLGDLRGRQLAIGPDGSGTRTLLLQLLAANGINADNTTLLPLGGLAAVQGLRTGAIDAACFVASGQSVLLQELFRLDGISLMSFRRAAAYSQRYRFLSAVSLAEGAINLEDNRPDHDVVLLAVAANLVVHRDFHPALADLLLQTAAEVHGPGGLFEAPMQFPSPRYLDLPLYEDARRYYEYGPSFLQRYLPFWAATLIDRTKIMILPLLALMFPLFKIMPPTYQWRMRARIYHWYRELQAVDDAFAAKPHDTSPRSYLAELDRIEAEVRRISVPLAYADALYELRLHIDFLRNRFRETQAAAAGKTVSRPAGAPGHGQP